MWPLVAKIEMRAPRAEDADLLAATLRPADRDEVEACTGLSAAEAIRLALRVSSLAWAIEIDDRLAILGGVRAISILEGTGSPWMLATVQVEHFPGALTKIGMQYCGVSLSEFPHLINFVDARNTKAIRWLRRLGFQLDAEPIPYGHAQLPFYRFEMRSSHV